MIENKARRNSFEEETHKIIDQSSPKICYLQVVASEDRFPRNTETKRQINPGNHGEGPKSRKRKETNPPRDYVPQRDDPKSFARTVNDVEKALGGFSITKSNDPADLALTLLARAGDVHLNPGPRVKCPVCTKGIYDKTQESVWRGRGGYVHLKCTNLTNSRQWDKGFECNKCSWCALVQKGGEPRKERERKRTRRKNIRLQKMRREVQEIKTTDILTWNLQKMYMQVNNRRKLRRFAFYYLRKRHNIVLMSEITAQTPGVIWLGEGRNSAAVIHSTKSAILHGGAWIDEGHKKCWGERVTSVTVAHLRLVARYQPLWQYGEETMEIYRRELEEQVTTSTHQQWLIIGGDHNSHMGYGGHRLFADGTKGPFGMGIRDCTGDDFLQGFEDNNLSWADSFVSMEHRGTWFNRLNAKWYE